jgi:hypothetical protein
MLNSKLLSIAENTLRDESERNSEIAVTIPDLSQTFDALDSFEELEVEFVRDLEKIFN